MTLYTTNNSLIISASSGKSCNVFAFNLVGFRPSENIMVFEILFWEYLERAKGGASALHLRTVELKPNNETTIPEAIDRIFSSAQVSTTVGDSVNLSGAILIEQ